MATRMLAAAAVALGLLLAAGSGPVRASNTAEALLLEAESIRSSDPERFNDAIAALGTMQEELTPDQQEHLKYLLAYAEGYGGNYERAAEMARQLADGSENIEMRFRAGSLVVNSYSATRRFADALRQLEANMLLLDSISDRDLRHHGLFVAGQVYSRVGQEQLSLKYAQQVLRDSPSPRTRCFAEQMKLGALENMGAMPADDAAILDVIAHCSALNESVMANLVRGTLARKWGAQGKRKEAVSMLEKHLPEMRATRFPRLIGEAHSLLAEFSLAGGDIDRAQAHVDSAMFYRASLTNSPPLVAAYRVRYEIAQRQGDPVAALSHYRDFAEADKAYLDDVKMRELAFQMVRHETQQKTQQIELLSQQNQVLQLQQRVQKQATQNMGLVVVLLALLLAGTCYWAYKVKRLHLTLRHFAETDVLTGISNRHHFTQQGQRSLEECRTAGEAATLIMFDLDRFKTINDNYGHDVGDWVLKQVASSCTGLCRRIDRFGRVGGEEFAILLHGCELAAAVRLAEDCRVRLNQIDTRESGYAFQIAASFGVTSTVLSGYSLATLMSHADLMLYRAKREGRNLVRAYSGDLPTSAEPESADSRGATAPQRDRDTVEDDAS
ncbi:MAG: diguanylate cyclase [Pseudomonadota bacterium]|nr:diguanylate cyclase [Pseudomonadota bacterium]